MAERRAALPESQEAARNLYDEAIARLERAAASVEATARFRAQATDAPTQLESIRQELSQPPAEPVPVVPADATLAQLEQLEADAIAALTAARELETQLQTETTNRQERRTQIRDALAPWRQDLARVEEALATAPSEETDPALADARRTALLAERHELVTKIEELEAELANYDARRDLLPARRDRASRRVGEAEKLANAWRELVSQRRQQEAERRAKEAEQLRRQAARQHPVLQEYAAETQRLAEQRTQEFAIPQRIALAGQKVAETKSAFVDLRQRYNAVNQRIEASGFDRATGLMLRREFESLPDLPGLKQQATATQRELEDVEYTLFERSDERIGSDDINAVTQGLLSRIEGEARDSAELESVATELARARRDVLADLENDADSYQDVLVTLGRETDRLLQATTEYESFIRERIFWVRSISGDRFDILPDLRAAVAWLTDGGQWSAAAQKTLDEALRRSPANTIAIALLVASFALGRWSKRRVAHISELVARYRTDGFNHTLSALVLTVFIAAPLSAVIWWAGSLLLHPEDQPQQAVSLGIGLQTAALYLFALAWLRQLIRADGVADAHFRWPDASLAQVRRHLRWFVPLVVPLVALLSMINSSGDEGTIASLGRVAFTVAMIAGSLLLQRLLRPHGPIVSEWLKQQKGGWADRLQYLWYPAAIATPVALAIVGWLGFFYTAIQLEVKIASTISLVSLLVIVNGMLLRWLFLARRRVAVEDARRRREQAVSAEADGSPSTHSAITESSIPPIDEDKVDLPGISLQTRQLFRTAIWVTAILGLYAIWADVLPALRMLDRVQVYPTQQVIEAHTDSSIIILETPNGTRPAPTEAAATTNGPAATTTSDAPAPQAVPMVPTATVPDAQQDLSLETLSVTLADVGLALIVLIATFIAFRNLPGLIEIMILQKLPLDAGSRYALSTVLRYAIALIGIAAAFGALDIRWSNIQWLAAALTFGLAFGLQEIFANFISGLIILAERPIRIGDTVTVGTVSGTVTRIRMRATTITDWDRKELVIPNKSFITGDVINWTLSDPTLRVIVPVGISYDADVRQAEKLLLDVAAKSSNVLAEPKPYVVFGKFGDSTLDFELRVFIPHVDLVLKVRHELHMRITETFRDAGIEIAYPQRDLHVRSTGDLRELIARPDELPTQPRSAKP